MQPAYLHSGNKIVRSTMKLNTYSADVGQNGEYLNQVGRLRIANTRIFQKRSNYYSCREESVRREPSVVRECSFGYLILLEVRHLSHSMQSAFERVRLVTNVRQIHRWFEADLLG